jgi:hypothetical protein
MGFPGAVAGVFAANPDRIDFRKRIYAIFQRIRNIPSANTISFGCVSTFSHNRRFCRPSCPRASNFSESRRSVTLFIVRTTLARSGLQSKSHYGASSVTDRVSALLAFVGQLRICFAASFGTSGNRLLLDHVSVVAESVRQN